MSPDHIRNLSEKIRHLDKSINESHILIYLTLTVNILGFFFENPHEFMEYPIYASK